MMASSRRVRVPRIIQKRKVLRLLPAILVGSKKEYFSLLLIFGLESQNIGQEQRKVSSIWPEERRESLNEPNEQNV